MKFHPPFSVDSYLQEFGRPHVREMAKETRLVYGDRAYARWHRVVGIPEGGDLVDIALQGRVLDQPWWFRQYSDCSEPFLEKFWNKPVNLADFEPDPGRENGLLYKGKPMMVTLHGPACILPYVFKMQARIPRIRLFTFGYPFVRAADYHQFTAPFVKSFGFAYAVDQH